MTPIKLLVVDDHEVLRQGLRFMLRGEPDVEIVGEATDGSEALELLRRLEPDVVLMDVRMPELDGLAALARIREDGSSVAVLMLSTYDDPAYVEEALRSGAAGYLLKTVQPDELLRAIRAVSSGDGYLQAEITKPVLRRFAATRPPEVHVTLSPREAEVLQLVADGLSTRQAAVELGISEATVKTYVRTLFEKLGATHRAHAVALALRHQIID